MLQRIFYILRSPWLQHVDERSLPMLQERIHHGSRWFIGAIMLLIVVWSLVYIKLVIPDADNVVTYLMITLMWLLYMTNWVKRFQPYQIALFMSAMVIHEIMWTVGNQITVITEVYSQNITLSMTGVIALFVPMRPMYLVAYGLLITEISFLILHYSTGAHWTYIALQVALGLLLTAIAALSSQVQRVTYQQMHQDEQRIRSQDRLLSMGERTEQIAAQLYRPLEEAIHTSEQVWRLLEQAHRMPRVDQHPHLKEALIAHQLATRKLAQTSSIINNLSSENSSTPLGMERLQSHPLQALWVETRRRKGHVNIKLVMDDPDLVVSGDRDWLSQMLSHIIQWWATQHHEHHKLTLRAEQTLLGVQLTLASPAIRENPMQGIQHALHQCQDIVEGIFAGSMSWDAQAGHLLLLLPQSSHTAGALEASFLPAFAPSSSPPRA